MAKYLNRNFGVTKSIEDVIERALKFWNWAMIVQLVSKTKKGRL